MGKYEQQIAANAAAIQGILDRALKISELPALTGSLSANDKTAFEIDATGETVYAKYSDIIGSTFVPIITSASLGDIMVFNGVNWVNLGAGTNGQVLSANNASAEGIEWVTGAGLQDLDSVTTQGYITTNTIRTGRYEVVDANAWIDLISNVLTLENDDTIELKYTGGSTLAVLLDGFKFNSSAVANYVTFENDFLTADRTLQAPNANGMIPLSVNNYLPDALGNIIVPNIGTPLTSKGDIFVYSTAEDRLPIGTNGQVLIADSAEDTGMRWGSVGAGDMILASVQTNTGLKTFLDGSIAMRNVANTFNIAFTNTATADRVATWQDKSGTVAYLSDLNTYIHDQVTPALQWDINHGLNRYPSVTAVDTAGYEIETQVRYIDANNVQVNCNEVTAGKGYLN